jgi:acyl-CoA dehydrogenase family protein 9
MESIYEGSLAGAPLQASGNLGRTERVRELSRVYRELLTEYPPSLLESGEKPIAGLLEKMKRSGFFGIIIPGEFGGLGFDLLEYLEVIGFMASIDISVALISLAHLSIGTKGIALFGSAPQKSKYLPPAATGEMIFSYALTEPQIGSDAKNIETTAILSGDGTHYTLNGRKAYITNANYAGGFTVFARMDPSRPGFLGAFVVEAGWDGVRIGKDIPKMGLKVSSTAAIQFKNVRVPAENLLGKPGEGFKIAMTILNYGRLGLGAASAGLMEQSAKDMLRRARSRVQFGAPIENFPLIREKIVQAKVHGFISSAMNQMTAGLLEQNPTGNAAIETSHCKLFGATRAWDALYEAMQTAGGSGYLSTQPYEKRMRDFRVSTIFEGATEIHSIYPPMHALRRLTGEMPKGPGKIFSRWVFLWKTFFRKTAPPARFNDKTEENAAKFARSASITIRRMLVLSLVLYGKGLEMRQFLLRRITTMSMYVFGVLAALARISEDRKAGRPVAENLRLLAYFLAEAREARQTNRSVLPTEKDKLNDIVFKSLSESTPAQNGSRHRETSGGSAEAGAVFTAPPLPAGERAH